jgi:hypothetical protein
METVNKESSNQEVRLAEYKASQSSAEHHDRLVWTVTSIVLSGSLIMMGIILGNPMKGLLGFVSLFLCILGIFLIIFVWITQCQFHGLKKQRYERCKEIEKELDMEVHSKTLWKEGFQKYMFIITMVLFLVAWLLVAMSVLFIASLGIR